MVTPRQPLEATMAQELSGERKRAPEKWRIEVHLLSTLKKKKYIFPMIIVKAQMAFPMAVVRFA